MPRIFISYRRAVSAGQAGRLYDRLVRKFGENSIFLDIKKIAGGDDFKILIFREIDQCDVFLALLSQGTLDRIHNDDDLVHQEIARALRNTRVHVIPILIDGFKMPEAKDLPPDLRSLPNINAQQLIHDFFDETSKKIIDNITSITRPAPPKTSRWMIAIVLSLIAVIIMLVIATINGNTPEISPTATSTFALNSTVSPSPTLTTTPSETASVTSTDAGSSLTINTPTDTPSATVTPTNTPLDTPTSTPTDVSTERFISVPQSSLFHIIGERNYLYIILPGAGLPDIRGFTLKTGGDNFTTTSLNSYDQFRLVVDENRSTRPRCLLIATSDYFNNGFIYPGGCNSSNTLNEVIAPANIFWYVPGSGYQTLEIAGGSTGDLFCSAIPTTGFNCRDLRFVPLPPTATPTESPTSTATELPTATATIVPPTDTPTADPALLYIIVPASGGAKAFAILKKPVTQGDFQYYLQQTGQETRYCQNDTARTIWDTAGGIDWACGDNPRVPPAAPSLSQNDQPRTNIVWHETAAYCAWFSIYSDTARAWEWRLPEQTEWTQALVDPLFQPLQLTSSSAANNPACSNGCEWTNSPGNDSLHRILAGSSSPIEGKIDREIGTEPIGFRCAVISESND